MNILQRKYYLLLIKQCVICMIGGCVYLVVVSAGGNLWSPKKGWFFGSHIEGREKRHELTYERGV